VFGENLTTEGLLETDVHIGDRMRVGSVELQVTQPRQPCYKLGIRFGNDDMVERFVASGRSGFYVAVVKEGDIARGDLIELTQRAEDSLTVDVIAALRTDDDGKSDLLRRAATLSPLPEGWKNHFRQRLSEHGR
jgi:MOSC domain-containing protein YiiM